jgi:hypothetical protein
MERMPDMADQEPDATPPMTIRQAERHMRKAKVKAEGLKQVAIAAAIKKLPGAEQAAAIRAAERKYFQSLAEAATATRITDRLFTIARRPSRD